MKKSKFVSMLLIVAIILTTVTLCFSACKEDEEKKEVVLRILENDTAKKEGYLKEFWTRSMQSMQAKG